jgi:hypothetical protein
LEAQGLKKEVLVEVRGTERVKAEGEGRRVKGEGCATEQAPVALLLAKLLAPPVLLLLSRLAFVVRRWPRFNGSYVHLIEGVS